MDLIHNDFVTNKMAMLVYIGTLSHLFAVGKINFVCSFHNIGPLDDGGKRLVIVMHIAM